ncbi:octaprenyl-diphosphate synthase [Balneicella halophila]|uniref:Octaprenyl-diphosphate synthase n=1 Tax=Balneicella halophila TaxID=1537566 RepID=A0A7L4USG8_BALHA|nr:polyprenyl synthetase family protein [Balneicella halophila]PVX51924.1 octaprenyl-diphosphate synthase [Balneicella halophila]
MITINTIKAPIKKELEVFQKIFKNSAKTDISLLNAVNAYIFRKKGKQLRPVLVLLSAKLCGDITSSSYTSATLVELFHTATLLHDDVVDDAKQRRGIASVYAIWKSKIAILAGDFLLSRSMLVALEAKEFDLLEIISNAVKEISEGELLQLDKVRKLQNTEGAYLTIIQKKTASLFAACAKAGATSATDDEAKIEKLYQYGLNLGIAFQMQDDLLDFDKTNALGKPLYNDLKERKMTLPFIFALTQTEDSKRYLKLFKKKKKTATELDELATFIRENGGTDYTEKQMDIYRDKALSFLDGFEDSPEKRALEQLAYFATARKK